ncbi:MAG TPA: 16S rRNA (guanine(966)-N(2))-methyltransferase RsmD [Candidatus Omnitrophica bacterium]|nr:16S rRNA (guanine(966)-N(2))-methyltransferase RsmD [Candidatus Omnitrophota bacterium]
MRIISGKFKSRKIDFPKNKLTRPMTDRTKETLFNMLGSLVFEKNILDLFSGSGSIGLEALSRGARHVTFVDEAIWAVKVIQKNLQTLELEPQAKIMQTDVLKAITKLEKQNERFSIIFVDPPFFSGMVKKALMKLDRSDIVLPFAQVIVGHPAKEPLPDDLQVLKCVRTKKIGQACLSFYFRLDASDEQTQGYLSGQL